MSAPQLEQLQQVNFFVADLSGARLGQSTGNSITIDINAAGHGWFIDTTPNNHEEFTRFGDSFIALGDSAANGHMDLLTVVMHELGHVLGHADDHSDGLMHASLPLGSRRLPS